MEERAGCGWEWGRQDMGYSATLSIPALSLHAGKKKNTWDDSELEQSGLHSAVRFLSAVLALRASLIPAFFFSFFCLPALLLLFLFFSSEFTFPSSLAIKRTLTRYHSHWKASGMVPLSPPPPSRVVFLHQDLNTQADVITPSPSFFLFFCVFLIHAENFFPLWSTKRFCLWAWIQTTQSWQLHREILMIRAMIIPVKWRWLTQRAAVSQSFTKLKAQYA